MNTFTELLSRLWPLWLLITHLGGALAVTLHALLRKREVASVTGWIGLAWLAPVIGPILYLMSRRQPHPAKRDLTGSPRGMGSPGGSRDDPGG